MVAIGEAMSQCHQPQISKCTHYTLCQVVRSYKTITLNECLWHILLRAPRGLLTPWGVAPNPTLAAWQGCRRRLRLTPTPQPLSIWSPPTCKACCYAVASQALTGFLLRPLRIVSLFSWRWKGVKAAKPCILPLMP